MGRESNDASAGNVVPAFLLCAACGARCASAPPLTLPELFRYERRFLATLVIRRMFAPARGGRLGGRSGGAAEDPVFEALAVDLFEQVRGPSGPEFVLLSAGTFGDEARAPCPAVADGHRQHLEALARRRDALAPDRQIWGRAVFELLRNELFDRPDRVGALPAHEALAISLSPALAVIAGTSPRCRARCIDFLSAQIDLAREALAPHAAAAPETQRDLVALLRASSALRGSLKQAAPPPGAHPRAREIEDWLGL